MKWNSLSSIEELNELIQKHYESIIVIFKHSTRCSVSSMALNRIHSAPDNTYFFIIDVIKQRDLSNDIAKHFNIVHQSPQALLIHQGKCEYKSSHFEISPKTIESQIAQLVSP